MNNTAKTSDADYVAKTGTLAPGPKPGELFACHVETPPGEQFRLGGWLCSNC